MMKEMIWEHMFHMIIMQDVTIHKNLRFKKNKAQELE